MTRIRRFLAAALVATLPLVAGAHGGEDHGEAPPLPAALAAPRAVAASDEFELVAVLAGGRLSFSLDRFATNEPVADARLEVESGAWKAVARQAEPGVYWIAADHFAAPGSYPLAITVEAGDSADLLAATLTLPPPPSAATGAPGWRAGAGWGGIAALLLAGAGWVAIRRRRNGAIVEERSQ